MEIYMKMSTCRCRHGFKPKIQNKWANNGTPSYLNYLCV